MTLPFTNENGLVGFMTPTIASSGGGLSIGAAVTLGTATRVLFEDTGPVLADDAALTFDKATGTLSATILKGTSLTATRVPFVGAAGILVDDADMTFVTDTLTVTKLSSTSFLSATTQSFTLNSVLSATLGVAAGSTPDADVVFGMGRFLVDSRTTDTVNMSHRDNTGSTAWAIQFGATGFVGMNALTGSSGALRANNVNKVAWSTVGVSFFNVTVVGQQTGPTLNLTNNITSGGTDGTFTNWTDLTTYATDAAAIRNAAYQNARAVKFCSDALRAYGLLT